MKKTCSIGRPGPYVFLLSLWALLGVGPCGPPDEQPDMDHGHSPDRDLAAARDLAAPRDLASPAADGSVARGGPGCPDGYARDPAPGIVLCRKGIDEIVGVGRGRTAFWIDRYEASVWANEDGSGSQYGFGSPAYPADPADGTYSYYALSVAGVFPSRYLSYDQALEACAASGKRLPSRREWLSGGRGTPSAVAGNPCSGAFAKSGSRPQCVSRWGALDMVGNAWEWTDEMESAMQSQPSGDEHTNIATLGTAAGTRGGDYLSAPGTAPTDGTRLLSLNHRSDSYYPEVGFRCMIPQ